nr:CbtA family protein [Pseudonocardia sp. HH130629-09]
MGVGMVFFGVAIGCLFGVAYCLAYGRVGSVSPRQLAVRVAGAGFLTMFLVPFLKYPANPPSIGNPDTIGPRSGLYLVMVVASVVVGLAALALGRRLAPRFGTGVSALTAGAAFVVVIGVVMALLPQLGSLAANAGATGASLTETPLPLLDPTGRIVFPGFDADLLYRFRLYSIGAQILLWGVLGTVFGALAERVVARADPAEQTEFASAT